MERLHTWAFSCQCILREQRTRRQASELMTKIRRRSYSALAQRLCGNIEHTESLSILRTPHPAAKVDDREGDGCLMVTTFIPGSDNTLASGTKHVTSSRNGARHINGTRYGEPLIGHGHKEELEFRLSRVRIALGIISNIIIFGALF